MASISANGSRGHHNFTLNVWENSTDTSSNTSNVGWSLVLTPIQAGWDWNISGISWNVNVNGVGYSGTIQSYDGRSTVTIASNSLIVGHDNNGDKQIGFSFSINDGANRSYTPGSCSSSGSMWLSHINRWAIVTSANNFNDEQNPTMTFSNPAGYTMNAWLELNPTGDHLCIRNNIPNTGSYTWELTSEEREQLRARCTGNSATIRYGIYSNIGGSLYASYINKTFTIVNGNPVFENFTYQDTNTAITNITGNNQVLVKGLSTLQATISTSNKMTAIKGTTEKNYIATIDTINQSQNYDDENDIVFNLGTINVSGTQKLNIRAYDNRNNSTLVSKDIRIYDYAKPVINFTAKRLNNFEAQTTLKINGSFSSLNIDNVEKNTIQSVQYRYKESNSETWGNWTNVLFAINNNEFNCSNVIIALDNTKEFDVEVKVTDNLSDNSAINSIDVGKSIFFISSNEKQCYINDKKILVEGDCKILSTEEKIIGVYNNKHLYAKTFFFSENHTANSSTVETYHLHNISDVEKIFIDQGSTFAESGGNSYIVGRSYINNNTVVFSMSAAVNSNNIRTEIYYGANITLDFTITLNYTKTTD